MLYQAICESSGSQYFAQRIRFMNIKTVEDLFIHLLSDTYSAEKQLTKALSKPARATSNEKLSRAFQSHLEETCIRLNVLIRSSNLNLALN